MPGQGKTFAAGAALVLLVAWHAGPATASSNTLAMCDDVADVTLEIPATELKANIVNDAIDKKDVEVVESATDSDTLSPTENLIPNVEAVLRKVFEESATHLADSDGRPAMNTRVPGVSDDDLARYKRQMYRTDI